MSLRDQVRVAAWTLQACLNGSNKMTKIISVSEMECKLAAFGISGHPN